MDDDVMAPMVDALTGAMAAILLVSIFLMVSTMSSVAESVKEYGKNALYKNEMLLADVFDLEPPMLHLAQNKITFFKSFTMSEEQIRELKALFSGKTPAKLLLYSGDNENVVTYNALLFMEATGLSGKIDNIEIQYLPPRSDVFTEFVWEF